MGNHVKTIIVLAASFMSYCSVAQLANFKDGPVIVGYGKHHPVTTATVQKDQTFKIAFDIAAPAEPGAINRKFDSLARFINMHVASGVPAENIELALVIHGKASFDLLNNDTYQKLYQKDNPNLPLLSLLMKNNVKVILCGQTAAAYEISLPQIAQGSHIELSAMTAHAQLQRQGFTSNPF